MKRFLLGASVAAMLFPVAANAQENEAVNDGNNQPKEIYTHSWRDNWYIQLGAGAQMPFFEKNPGESNFDLDKTTAIYEAAVGHWFSPYFGFRFRGQGGALHYENGQLWKKTKYANLNLDLQWDMFNSLGGVNEKRVFSILPYIGVGGTYAWGYNGMGNILDNDSKVMDHQGVISGTFGLEFRFRCSNRIDLYLDARATGTADNINNIAWRTGVDPILSLTGGIKINLGKDGRHVTKYVPYDCSGEIRALNDRINRMRDDLADKDARLRAAEAQLPCPEVKEQPKECCKKDNTLAAPAIRFRFNSSTVSSNDKATIYDVAQMLKKNSDVKVIVKGYADKKTGSESYNKKLAERRANAVKAELVNNGIDESRIATEAVGVSEQPYADNNSWNRVAIIYVND